MMFIEGIIVSVAAGFMLGGTLKKLKDVSIRHLELIFSAFAVEFIITLLIREGILTDGTVIYILHLSMYIILFTFIYMNKRYFSILTIGAGFLLNAAAIFANGGVMPVAREALVKAGMGGAVIDGILSPSGLYKLMDGKTLLPYLCDIIPKPYIMMSVISIGDIFIVTGLFFLILGLMGCKGFSKVKDA
jgi:hypothetical protein